MELTDIIIPNWAAPESVAGCCTTRLGGVSNGPYASLNLGLHVGDGKECVLRNRELLEEAIGPGVRTLFVNQVHGTEVAEVSDDTFFCKLADADAIVTRMKKVAIAIMTADCLPVLFCSKDGTVVGAAHAGWRGLLAGVLENCVSKLGVPSERVVAWLGPRIGDSAFEVGAEVREQFVQNDSDNAKFFKPSRNEGKYLCSLAGIAKQRLVKMGILSSNIADSNLCTYSDPARFYSYRRDGQTGRMATLVWIRG